MFAGRMNGGYEDASRGAGQDSGHGVDSRRRKPLVEVVIDQDASTNRHFVRIVVLDGDERALIFQEVASVSRDTGAAKQEGSVNDTEENYDGVTVVRLTAAGGGTVHIVGTAHVSERCCKDVKNIIRRVRPKVGSAPRQKEEPLREGIVPCSAALWRT